MNTTALEPEAIRILEDDCARYDVAGDRFPTRQVNYSWPSSLDPALESGDRRIAAGNLGGLPD